MIGASWNTKLRMGPMKIPSAASPPPRRALDAGPGLRPGRRTRPGGPAQHRHLRGRRPRRLLRLQRRRQQRLDRRAGGAGRRTPRPAGPGGRERRAGRELHGRRLRRLRGRFLGRRLHRTAGLERHRRLRLLVPRPRQRPRLPGGDLRQPLGPDDRHRRAVRLQLHRRHERVAPWCASRSRPSAAPPTSSRRARPTMA